RCEATVVVDPALLVLSPPARPAPGATLEEALDALVRDCPGAAWRAAYLPAAQRRALSREREQLRLVAAVRAQDALEGSLLLEDPAAGRFTASLKKESGGEPAREALARAALDERPVYVLYAPRPLSSGGSLEEQYATLQRRQIDLMLRMTPAQMEAALDPVVRAYHAADPSTREGLLGLPLVAGMMAVWFPRQAKEQRP
ncbi:MAG TPA: hypothetical protein VFU47_12065, partial [Armatimonadota bacterium]|nr:hypothetical protein [Armatimonadota bacterium]